jgi:hypothetical protein
MINDREIYATKSSVAKLMKIMQARTPATENFSYTYIILFRKLAG